MYNNRQNWTPLSPVTVINHTLYAWFFARFGKLRGNRPFCRYGGHIDFYCFERHYVIMWLSKCERHYVIMWLSKCEDHIFIWLISIVSNSYYGMLSGQIHINLPPEHPIIAIWNNRNQSNEDMILALAWQFMQLSHEPEKFKWLNRIRTHDLCDAGAVL